MPEPEETRTRRTRKWPSQAGSILCFHSITDPGHPSASDTHVPLSTLATAIAVSRLWGEIVPLRELVARHQAGKSTAGLAVLTFDDAYAALLGPTLDLLRREQVPATIFVTTRAARSGARFWWDRLDEACLRASPERWKRFERECGVPDAYRGGQFVDFGPVWPMRQWLLAEHRGRWPAPLETPLAALEREVDAPGETVHRSCDFQELAGFAALDLLDFGVHTVSHPVLPLLPEEELRREVTECHAELRERFERTLPVLAVPFGLLDRRTVHAAREAGMTATLSLSRTTLAASEPGEEIPRICITRGEPGWKLALRMGGVAELVSRWRGTLPDRYPPLPSPTG